MRCISCAYSGASVCVSTGASQAGGVYIAWAVFQAIASADLADDPTPAGSTCGVHQPWVAVVLISGGRVECMIAIRIRARILGDLISSWE